MRHLGQEGKVLFRAIRSPFTLLALSIILLSILAAYQVQQPMHLEIESPAADPLLEGFYPSEQGPSFSFRWTSGDSSLRLAHVLLPPPLVIRMRMASSRQEAVPLTVSLGDADLPTFAVQPAPAVYEVVIPSEQPIDQLQLRWRVPTFQAPGDRRPLGVVVDWIEIHPLGRQLVLPPVAAALAPALLLLLVYLVLLFLTSSPRAAALWTLPPAAAMGCLVACYRSWLDPVLAPAGVILCSLCLLAIASRCLIGATEHALHLSLRQWETIGLVALILLSFALTTVGLLNPFQPDLKNSYDLRIHVPALNHTASGRLYFLSWTLSGRFGEAKGLAFPYPPALYVLLAPGTLLLSPMLTMILAVAALRALGGFFLFLAVRVNRRDGLAALLTAGLYTVTPVSMLVLWWGQFTNDFGQCLLLILWCFLCVVPLRPARLKAVLLLGLLLTLLFLSHIGVLMLTGVVIALYAVLLLLRRDREGPLVLGGAGASALVVAALYYSNFASTLFQSGQGRLSGGGGGVESFTIPAFLRLVARYLHNDYLWITVLLAALGLVWVLLRAGLSSRMERVALPWMATAALFALEHLAMGFGLGRYVVFLVPVVCSYGGVLLAQLWRRGRWGRIVVAGLLAMLLYESLVILVRAYLLNQTPVLYL